MSPPDETPRSFEERLAELGELVEELERGDLPLEDAIERFEAGRALHRGLLKELQGYETRIEELLADDDEGAPRTAPLPTDEGEGEASPAAHPTGSE